jgi:DNA end-binding protein Ku
VPPRRARSRAAAAEATAERPSARGVWTGSISFGLVTIPVELFSATRRVDLKTRMLSPDGEPLSRQYVCPSHGRALEDDEIERGFEIEEGKFVPVSDAELEKLAPRRSRDIELRSFVDRDAIDPAYVLRPDFVLPAGVQTRAYRLLAETMEATRRAALADFVMRGKAYAIAIFADRGVLRAETLRFADELRPAADLGIPIVRKPDAALVAKMSKAIAKLEEPELDERELRDESDAALLEVARAKLKRGRDVVKVAETTEADETRPADDDEPATGNVIDLFAVIQRRLRAAGKTSMRKAVKKTATPRKKAVRRRKTR